MLDFWAVIGDGSLSDAAAVSQRLGEIGKRLDGASPMAIVRFDGQLREYLFQLDRRPFAEIQVSVPGVGMLPQTEDHFLYARCACVLAGLREYHSVLQGRTGFET
ncbi:DUF4240 domain-containing protein [Actinoplanes rectilineatus]|uniref:DUF4240 domain-containing protein n=1 Tax=Actinoplanes rectilineatus TaxID=113571 RepID=UPI0014700EBA|nr:DUF4240 domain-containing protein [Actinoplanes rectilineatus]